VNARLATVMLCGLAASIAGASPLGSAAAMAQQQRAVASGPARLQQAVLRADPSLATTRPAVADGGATPPADAAHDIAAFAEQAPTLESCERLSEQVEAWNGWAESMWLWQFAVVGLPDDAEVRNAKAAGASILALSAAACEGLTIAIEDADRQPALRRDEATEQRIADALHLREVVLPLRAARAAIVIASLSTDADARAGIARAAMQVCRQVAGVSPWAEAERALLLAHGASILGDAEEAMRLFGSVERGGLADGLPAEFASDVRLEAMLGAMLSQARALGPIAAQRELDTKASREPVRSWLASSTRRSLLAADASMRLSRVQAAFAKEQAQRDQSLSLALARYADALSVDDLMLSREQVTNSVLLHLARVLPARQSYQDLHPVAAIARARALAAEPASRLRAVAILDEAMGRPPAELGSLVALVMFDLAAACAAVDDPALLQRAVTLFLAFADRFPADERAGLAVALACAASDHLLRLDTNNLDAAGRIQTALDTLRRAHTAAVDVPDRDSWRLALARLLIWRVESGLVSPADALVAAREAAAALSSIREPRLALPAAVERAAAWNAVLAMPDADPATAHEVSTRLLAAIEDARAERAIDSESTVDVDARLAVFQGRAALAGGSAAEAFELVAPLVGDPRPSAGSRIQSDAMVIALQAQIRLATPIERALETALQLETIRPGAARSLVERMASAQWSELLPLSRGLVVSGVGARVEPSGMLALFLAARLAGEIESGVAGEAAWRRVAWALLLTGRTDEAAELFDRLSQAKPEVLEYRRGGAEAHLAKGEDQEAFARFRGIVSAADPDASPWFAWTRMMEILARHNEDGKRSAEIRREIARLRTLQSALERPDCLDRLRAIEDALPAP
jgi:tetratricopeptide (TPR) repeat protein